MVLDHAVFLRHREFGIIFTAEERPRRCQFDAQRELATTACVDRVIDRRTAQLEVNRQVMGCTVSYQEVRPIFHHIHLITELTVEGEIIIRPAQTLTITD